MAESSARVRKASWPASTPTLKKRSAEGISGRGIPARERPLANPMPWSRPKAKATSQGWRMVIEVSARHLRTISGPRKRMLRAMAALSGSGGTVMIAKVESARVRLWAMVKEVTVLTSIRAAVDEQEEAEDEEEVVDAEEDVFDAEAEVGAGEGEARWGTEDRAGRVIGFEEEGLRSGVQQRDADEGVGEGGREAEDGDGGSGEAAGAGDAPA